MNLILKLCTTESKIYYCSLNLGATNNSSNFTRFSDILDSQAIENLSPLDLHKMALEGYSPTEVHGYWNGSLYIDLTNEPELQ